VCYFFISDRQCYFHRNIVVALSDYDRIPLILLVVKGLEPDVTISEQ